MLSSIWVASALCAVAFSAPTLPFKTDSTAGATNILSEYFSLLGSKVQEGRGAAPPVCDLSKAVMPVASPTPLPPPSKGLTLKHVAIGRGTQNYSCPTSDSSVVPAAVGALATLYNASCVASTYSDILAMVPRVALEFNLTSTTQKELVPSNLQISGHHYFTSTTTPFFNLNTPGQDLGDIPCAKNNTASPPANAAVGQNNVGFGAVAWLKLVAKDGATGGLQEVYRINTAGGNPPPTCAGMPSTFEVPYSAEYWFYSR
ncbi:hypothetical protein F5884DRAFT_773843 [Xylogone sp. PMI_703]|nr:hypothetical protein F5884DRAFT_773843 [Xylogone sp. PMI_703]